MTARTRLVETPLLDRFIQRLDRLLVVDGARHELVSFMNGMNRKTERYWSDQLAKIIHRRRLPNAEVLLVIQTWMKKQ